MVIGITNVRNYLVYTYLKLQYSTMACINKAKRAAADTAVNDHVNSGDLVGIGSGSTVVFAVERLGKRVRKEKLQILCVPTSFQARQLAIQHKLPLTDLEIHPCLDVCIDGADEVDSNMDLIKGGGGCLLQEKIVASCSKKLVIIADSTKDSEKLGDQYKKGIPIEVSPMAYVPIKNRIEQSFGGNVELRMAVKKAGPVITDSGNFILDWRDFDQNNDWNEINTKLLTIPGIVDTGLFIQMASIAYFGMSDGTVKSRVPSKLKSYSK